MGKSLVSCFFLRHSVYTTRLFLGPSSFVRSPAGMYGWARSEINRSSPPRSPGRCGSGALERPAVMDVETM